MTNSRTLSIKPDDILELAMQAATEAGAEATRIRQSKSYSVSYKGDRNLVTTADLLAEKIIIGRIREKYPDHGILAEESSPTLSPQSLHNGPLWIIDPIDGTTNFAHGHFNVGVSIAFAFDGIVEVGVVHAPFLNETFSASKGKGAFLNGEKVVASETTALSSALIGTGFPYERNDSDRWAQDVTNVIRHCRDIRRIGAASLDISWVACGRLDGFYETLCPWDLAAACLIAREAGAITGNMEAQDLGKQTGGAAEQMPKDLNGSRLVVANHHLYDKLCELLK